MRLFKITLFIAVIGFITNLVWENWQAPLYKGYINFWQHFPMCFFATLGDVFIILILYFVFALFHRDRYWILNINKNDILTLLILGIVIAVGIEKWELFIGRWQYNLSMPLFFGVGLLPVLQMALLPSLTFVITEYYISR